MSELQDYYVTLLDERVNTEVSYRICGAGSGDLAIVRAKINACADAGIDRLSVFTVVRVEAYPFGALGAV